MAKEAIMKIKEAEDSGNEAVFKALEQAKQISRNAEGEAETKFKDIISEANKVRLQFIETAKQEATSECEPLIKDAESELQGINNPNKEKQNKTIQLIVERIVNVNGSR